MSKPSYGNLTAAEQAVLDGVTVRLVEAGEVARFNARLVALDGKENRSSQGTKLVNAYAVKSGRWLGSEPVPAGTNEIPTAATEKLSPS
jgi:hypothetical protein